MDSSSIPNDTRLVQFPEGKVIGARWIVKKILGSGSYGTVYEVQNVKNPLINGALKAESNSASNSILKLEVEVLKQLQKRKYTVRLLHSAKRETYSYMVMTLCGPDLFTLKHTNKLVTFSESTILRIAILSLYAIKQLHEVGYVHRDIKPSNIAISPSINCRHILYLLDYGMVRRYAIYSDKQWLIRPPRKRARKYLLLYECNQEKLMVVLQVLLRGTLRYCSINTHRRQEQGRVDDLWSLMYMLVDLRANYLPWGRAAREDRILYLKESISDQELLSSGNLKFYTKILAHLRKLQYPDRPDYLLMYKLMISPIMRKQHLFDEPYDWENVAERVTQEDSFQRKLSRTSSSRSASGRLKNNSHSIPDDIPIAQEKAFSEGKNDVPDIMKTSYHASRRRSDRDRQNQEESNGDLP